MKIKIYLPNYRFFEKYGFIGGHVEHVKGTVEGFLANGFDVELVSSDDVLELKKTFPNKLGDFVFQPIEPVGGRIGHYFFFSLLLLKSLFSGKQTWIYLRYSASFLPIFLLFLCAHKVFRGKSKIFLEVNSFGSNYFWAFTFVDRLLKYFSIQMILVSKNLFDHWKRLAGRRSKPAVQIIPNGIMSNKVRPVLSGVAAFESLSYLGVLKPNYGIEELCESFVRLPGSLNLELNIIGDGPLLGILEERFGINGRLNFIGPLIGENLMNFIDNNNTAMLYPSVGTFKFQSPVKLYDYLAFGKPIISADEDNAREVLGSYDSCEFCDINRPQSLQNAIRNLRSKGSKLDISVHIAQKHAVEVNSWEKRIKALIEGVR